MIMTATARSIDGGLRNEIDVNGRHTIITDEPVRLGGSDSGPAPHELLPAILAACVSTMVVTYARQRKWAVEDVVVDAEYDPGSTPRHVALRLHLPDGLTEDQVNRLQRVAESCPAKRSLEVGFAFDQEILFEPEREPSLAS
jgi:putative redox protein